MPVVASIDYPARRIYLSAETMTGDFDTLDVYTEVRERRATTEADRGFAPIISAGGNIEKKTGETYTERYVQLLSGCRLVPYNSSHALKVIRDTFTDDGFSGRDCFDRSSLSPSVDVDIDVDVKEVEVRVISSGSALTPAESTTLANINSAVRGNSTYNSTTELVTVKDFDSPGDTLDEFDVVVTDGVIVSKTRR